MKPSLPAIIETPQNSSVSLVSNEFSRRGRNGFALAVVLLMLVLLTVTAVGLLSLSPISLRASGQGLAKARAQANARLAIALAIGQLQQQAGPDARITAPADFLDPANPEALANPGWRGVWRSNQQTPKNYQPAREDFFSEWLVTGSEAARAIESARGALAGASTVICKTDGMPDVRVPLLTAAGRGGLGWWTDDESMKARADLPLVPPSGIGETAVALHAAPRLGPESLSNVSGFDPAAETMAAMVTPGQMPLGAEKWPDRQGRQFTTYSRSVMSDARDGGLKQDLSTLFEQSADRITEFGKWSGRGSESDSKVYLYGPPAAAMGARWNHLYAYYNLYKDVTFSRSEPRVEPKGGLIDWRLADQYSDFGDGAGGFRFPRMAKIIYVFSYTAVKDSNASNPKPYRLQLATDIFVTLWNPFDARIQFPVNTKFYAKLFQGLPMKFAWRVNGAPAVTLSPNDSVPEFISPFNNPFGDRQFSMSPGETVVFSLKKGSSGAIEFWPGVHYADGLTSDITQITGTGSEKISVGLNPDQNSRALTIDSQGNSQYMDFWIWDSARKWPYYEHRGEILARADAPFLRQMRPIAATDVPSATLRDVVGRKQPFGAFIMETKTALDSTVPIPAFLNTGITRLSSKLSSDLGEFANERLEYKVEAVTGFDSDIIQVTLPSNPDGANHGYIGSGRGPATGQTHFLFSSIPTVPPTSLAQFRHAGVGDGASTLRATYWGFNSTPNAPYADQSIGNSYAHPLIPPNLAKSRALLDHRYLGNEVLWDKYFLSSLAPRSRASFGSAARTMSETWKDFLDGKAKLINPRFSPWLGADPQAAIHRRSFPSNRDSSMEKNTYKRIAANLMFDGGFNINSTSVEAWQAFLASAHGRTITKLSKRGGTNGVDLQPSGAVFSRTETVLADAVDTGSDGLASQYCGFRELSDEDLAMLAKEIVKQVRKRGPFLNLSEFINRRLTTDTDLALSGALQTAIDDSGLNDEAAAEGMAGTGSPNGAKMAFPAASELNTAAGNPGWLMQADLLDPLGPAIVARGDTFRIRGYGEARDAGGAVIARAWCEAVVQRAPDYMDSTEAAEIQAPKKPSNKQFGRRFHCLSVRWLNGPND